MRIAAHLDFAIPTVWSFKGDEHYPIKTKLACNSSKAQLEAALAGLGLAFTSCYHVKKYLKSGKLVQILEDYMPKPVQIIAVYRKMPIIPIKITKFIKFIEKHLRTTNEK